ncbi:MAG: hypothetical protein M3R24_22740 [Chloroflexota bacterium]|nr:hypothetical protein [Chloroflexota bacterium]
MVTKLSKAELITLVDRLLQAEGTAEETLEWLNLIERNVPSPHVQGLIYWPHRYGLGDTPTAEEIVEKALRCKPILL